MRLQFIGCGDAFGSGGRFNTCFHVVGGAANFIIDCGASSLVAMKRMKIDRNAIDNILLTHFHADHFGGVPFFCEDAQLVARRDKPLTLVGPSGLREWTARWMDTAFAGSSSTLWRFPIIYREVEIGCRNEIGTLSVTPLRVRHDDRAGPCLAYRIEVEGKIIAFSGDTEWTDELIEVSRGADIFICECYVREKPVKGHMSLAILREKLTALAPKRLILTHMSDDMLQHIGDVTHEAAEDGKVIDF